MTLEASRQRHRSSSDLGIRLADFDIRLTVLAINSGHVGQLDKVWYKFQGDVLTASP